jgi:coenzyme F420-0:L-glutamate ligase
MQLTVFGVDGIGEIEPGDDLAAAIATSAALEDGDVLVVTQKIVSKSEGMLEKVDPDDPLSHKTIVERESVRVLRRRGDLVISETKHGFVCANAGVDVSNVERGYAALLPEDSDRSARRIRDGLRAKAAVEVAVIVSDTFGRTWRRGLTDVAIGCAGIGAILDLRGSTDTYGREMLVTEVAVVDEIASAAELVMGKAAGVPVAVVRGVPKEWLRPGKRQRRADQHAEAGAQRRPEHATTQPRRTTSGRPRHLRRATSTASTRDAARRGRGRAPICRARRRERAARRPAS